MPQVGGTPSSWVWFRNLFFNLTTQVYRHWQCAGNNVSIDAVPISILKLYAKKHVLGLFYFCIAQSAHYISHRSTPLLLGNWGMFVIVFLISIIYEKCHVVYYAKIIFDNCHFSWKASSIWLNLWSFRKFYAIL